MRALLDVNVLIALMATGHIHHTMAIDWMENNLSVDWASCPITQNGCIRIMSQPSYPGSIPATQVAERLAEARSLRNSLAHEYTEDLDLVRQSIFRALELVSMLEVATQNLCREAVAFR
jgi:predicted nucleic acid-binding protein